MDVAVVSERLSELLDNCEVKAAVFTTYTFDPEFFEQEVVPLLLPGEVAFSSDTRIKKYQVREALRESGIKLEVFFDLPMFRREGTISPSMEYRFQGVYRGNNAFHAKLALILVHDHHHEQDCLMVGAGSNNLTRAGWWENIECLHWEMVWPADAPRQFLKQLIADVDWLAGQRSLSAGSEGSGLDLIVTYLSECTSRGSAPDVSYYGLEDVNRRGAFPGFLARSARKRSTYTNWTLEIISPFFAQDPDNEEHAFFLEQGLATEIHILLPTDQEGNALCSPQYFDNINSAENVSWAYWASEADRDLGLKGQFYRRLHAKVYHFYNRRQSWAFIGSVNFSHKAMRENIEAGFFVKLDRAGPLLKPITQLGRIEHFINPLECEPGDVEADFFVGIPKISLTYDWRDKKLTGVTEAYQSYTISIVTPEGSPAVKDFAITGTPREFEGDGAALERLLRNGSLVRVMGVHTRSAEPFPTHTVLLQQTSWTHKPLDLPDLSAAEILSIYAGLSMERRLQRLVRKVEERLVQLGEAGDITLPEDGQVSDQFFAEYAEIFHAFRHLRKRLDEASQTGNTAVLDYYLSGAGKDSLPTLIEHAGSGDSELGAVTRYLIMLCAKELYQQVGKKMGADVAGQLRALQRHIGELKKPGVITLEDDSAGKRRTFFRWFETEFFRVYRLKEQVQ